MSWIENLIYSPETIKARKVEYDKNHGIHGNYLRRYKFTYTHKQFIAPDTFVNNSISGIFDCGVLHVKPDGETRWSIEMRDLQFDWNENALPEKYFIFAFGGRMDIDISGAGNFFAGGTWVDLCKRWGTLYKQQLFEHITDRDRAQTLYNTIDLWNQDDALQILSHNPLVSALEAITFLNANLNNPDAERGANAETLFPQEITFHNYFFPEIDLPLKTAWLQQPLEENDCEIYLRIGGLEKEKFNDEKLRSLIRRLADTPNLHTPVNVDSGEIYEVEKINSTLRLLRAARLELTTIIKNVWTRQDILALTTDKGGVIYG